MGVGISDYGVCNAVFNLPQIKQQFNYAFNLNVKNRSLVDFADNAKNDWGIAIAELSAKQDVLRNSLTGLPLEEKKEIQKQIDNASIDIFLYKDALKNSEFLVNSYKTSSILLLSGSIPIAVLGSILIAFWIMIIINCVRNRRNKTNTEY